MEMYWERQLLVFVAWSAYYNGKWGGLSECVCLWVCVAG